MNKTAVALAADSAVTIGVEGKKTYNTVNKLFTLSKYHPVGIMIYDNADFMGVPWETIIKLFRSHLSDKKCDTLRGYYDAFIEFIESENILFSNDQQESYFYNLISFYFLMIQQAVDMKIKALTDCNTIVTDKEIKEITDSEISSIIKRLEECNTLPELDDAYTKALLDKYKDIIIKAKTEKLKKLPLSKKNHKQLEMISSLLVTKHYERDHKTGLIVSGFGDKEIFPSTIDCSVECLLCGKLKKYNEKEVKINSANTAAIVPFAQKEMPHRFMEGIDPDYADLIEMSLREVFYKFPDALLSQVTGISKAKKDAALKKVQGVADKIIDNYFNGLTEFRRTYFVDPVLNAVSVLPKDEMAAMAESLVHLTSLKRKFSMEQETVAGPIDVAIISKGDGFVWIKRKHYFTSELNPTFVKNYFAR
jgi:hypothetical protein